jgi:type IV fimbrial biogenesis protein FimT
MTAASRFPNARAPWGAQGGFTIIELLMVMVILGIMMGLGIPSFRNFVAGQRVKSAATELMTTVLMSRSEAIRRNVAAGVTITPAASGWAGGWSAAYSGTILQQQEALQGITVTTYSDTACSTQTAVANIVFSNTGRAGASSCFKFASESSNNASRCVKVDLTGIPSSGSCP